MTTLFYTHPVCIEHDPGSYHPECPDRLRAILDGLEEEEYQFLHRHEAPEIDISRVKMVHKSDYVDLIMANVPRSGHVALDPDTAMSPASGEAARRASGAAVMAVDKVVDGDARNAFCAVRPPGHHAEKARAMGFCLFNNVAIAAFYAYQAYGMERVAVVDFDVHHGNGTQHIFESDAGLFYASSHQWPCYPGTGSPNETGVAGNIVNVPLAPESGSERFRAAYTEIILPALRDFDPELLIISAGFDAHRRDPLAQLNLETADYGWVTRELLQVAADHCDNRVISLLEGGYDLTALCESTQAHVKALMEA